MALKNKIIDIYLVWSQSQFYLLCAGHLRLKKLLPIYTWDSILIFEFIWQLMGSIPQPWSFTWKLELWRPISFLVLFQKVYTRIRWDNLLPSNLGNNFELDMKFFWPCFFPFGGEGETLFSSNMHIISDIKCTCIYMYGMYYFLQCRIPFFFQVYKRMIKCCSYLQCHTQVCHAITNGYYELIRWLTNTS